MLPVPQRVPWTRQPTGFAQVNRANPITSGLRRLIVPGINRASCFASGLPYREFVSGTTPAPIGYVGDAVGLNYTTTTNEQISIPAWTNTTSEGSAFLLQRGTSGYNHWVNFGTTASDDTWGWGTGVYIDAFWDSRWGDDVRPPSGKSFTDAVRVGISVKNGTQKLYWDGTEFHANTRTNGFYLPTNIMFPRSFNGVLAMLAVWDRFLSEGEHCELVRNPWQLFA